MTTRCLLLSLLCLTAVVQAQGQSNKTSVTVQEPAQGNDAFALIGFTGYDGLKTFKVVGPSEYSDLAREARLDNEALPIAYAHLGKAWRESHAKAEAKQKKPVHPPPFPLKYPAPREVRQLGTFKTAELAAREQQTLESQEAARLKRLETAKEPDKVAEPANTGLKRPPVRHPANLEQDPDSALVKQTLDALINEIAVVRADKEAGTQPDGKGVAAAPAPKQPPKTPNKGNGKKK